MIRHSRICTFIAAALAALLVAACSAETPGKRTFMDANPLRPQDTEVAIGLNPLGALDVCRDASKPLPLDIRVLVSRPEQMSRGASQMLVALRQGLADPPAGEPLVQMMLSTRRIASDTEAMAEGQDCGALVVLWEPAGAQTLEVAFPFPARIPLRDYSLHRLCAVGSFYQRVNVLYYTILGTANIMNSRFDRAQHNLQLANMIDTECLKLPDLLPAG